MDSRHPSKTARRTIAVLATVSLGAGWSASALSATTTDIECSGLAHDLWAVEIPAETFSVSPIDHVSIDSAPASIELLDTSDATSESVAPFLYLTPRVASVLRGIFEATSESSDQEISRDVSWSPLAESDRLSDISELIDDSEQADDEVDLPLFQRQMFRTDI